MKNRRWRNASVEEKKQCEIEYYTQKKKVQKMVKEAIQKQEKKITDEIRQSRDNGKSLWKNINKLKGKELNTKVDILYL